MNRILPAAIALLLAALVLAGVVAMGCGAAGARRLEQLSSSRGDLQIVPGNDHGTDLLTGRQAAKVYQSLLDFIKASEA